MREMMRDYVKTQVRGGRELGRKNKLLIFQLFIG